MNTTYTVVIACLCAVVTGLVVYIAMSTNSQSTISTTTDTVTTVEPLLTTTPDDVRPPAQQQIRITPASDELEMLRDSQWRWLQTENAELSLVIMAEQSEHFLLTFNPDGVLEVGTDCNQHSGQYTIDEAGALTISALMGTRMFCENSQENEYVAQLQAVTSAFIREEYLILPTAEELYMRFEQVQ